MKQQELLERIRVWLKTNGKTRQDLASLIGVSKRTVDNWFSGRPMNPSHAFSLELLLKPNDEKEKAATVVLKFTDEQMERLKANFSSMEELELALKSFILGSLYDKAVKIVKAYGIDLPDSGELEAAEPGE